MHRSHVSNGCFCLRTPGLPRLAILGVLGFLALAAPLAWGAPAVVDVEPTPQGIQVVPWIHPVVSFDAPLDAASIDASTVRVMGRWSGPAAVALQLEAEGMRVRIIPERFFFAGEWVTVMLSRGIRGIDGTPLAQGYTWGFWVRSLPGSLDQSLIADLPIRREGEGPIRSYGAYAGDLDGDGWSDLAIPNEDVNDVRVFLNDGGMYGPFTVHPLPAGAVPSPSEGADFDGDGILDLAVGNAGNTMLSVLMGDGAGGFLPEVAYPADQGVRGVAVMDLDGDGHDDVVTANRSGNNIAILRNQGDGTFAPAVTLEAEVTQETSCAAADVDGDGILDLFVGGLASSQVAVLLGDGEGGLVPTTVVPCGGSPWMLAAGDLNGDGHADVAAANSFANRVGVAFGDGAGGLSAFTPYPTGDFSLAIDLGDLDGDGDLDLVSSNFQGNDWTVYENDGSGIFGNPRTYPASSAGSCAILHDRDNDGDLDITGIDELDDRLMLFENTPSGTETPGSPQSRIEVLSVSPNPFNPRVTVRFRVEIGGEGRAAIHDARGRWVTTLWDGPLAAGEHRLTWGGEDTRGRPVASGVYRVRVEVSGARAGRPLVLVR